MSPPSDQAYNSSLAGQIRGILVRGELVSILVSCLSSTHASWLDSTVCVQNRHDDERPLCRSNRLAEGGQWTTQQGGKNHGQSLSRGHISRRIKLVLSSAWPAALINFHLHKFDPSTVNTPSIKIMRTTSYISWITCSRLFETLTIYYI